MDRSRLLCAALAGVLAFAFCVFVAPGRDVAFPFLAARDLLRGINPYTQMYGDPTVTWGAGVWLYYPLPAVLICAPFTVLPDWLGMNLITALAFAVYVYALLAHPFWYVRLLGYPAFMCLVYGQPWPLITAAAFSLPWLAPLTLAKPNLALPVLFNRPGWHAGAVALSAALVALSLAFGWLSHLGSNDRFVSLAQTIPGFALIVLVPHLHRSWQARMLLLACLLPQRVYDLTMLSGALPAATLRRACLIVGLNWLTLYLPLVGDDPLLRPAVLVGIVLGSVFLSGRRTPSRR